MARKQRRGKGGEDPVPDRLETLRDASRAAAIRGESQLAARYGLLSVLLRHRHQKSLTLGDRVVACRKCGMARTSTTSTTRIRKGRITATCHNCQNVLRHTLR